MRTVIIWQTKRGPVLVDKASSERIENCKQLDIAPISANQLVEATIHLWPEDVAGTIQHGLEPTLERVHVEFAPLFPSVVNADNELPKDYSADRDVPFLGLPCRIDEAQTFDDDDGRDRFGQPHFGHPPTSSGPGEVT